MGFSDTVTCTTSTEEIEIQTCASHAENVCKTEDVVSEEITYEKRCKEITCCCTGVIGHWPLAIVKREAEAPVAYAVPQAVTKTIETPCTEFKTEHCVDVPIIKPVVTPVETCHAVTRVECTPAVHSIPKVTCEVVQDPPPAVTTGLQFL